MSNYRRLISYIYAYEGGVKGKNIGFAKIEIRNGQCRIHVNVKRVFLGNSDIGVYLLSPQKEILLGRIFIRNGAGEFRVNVNAGDVENSGCSMEQCYGLTIHETESTWRTYTTIWEDAVTQAAEVELADITAEKMRGERMPENFSSASEEIQKDLERETVQREGMTAQGEKEKAGDEKDRDGKEDIFAMEADGVQEDPKTIKAGMAKEEQEMTNPEMIRETEGQETAVKFGEAGEQQDSEKEGVPGKEAQKEEVQGGEIQSRETQGRKIQEREIQDRETQDREVQNEEVKGRETSDEETGNAEQAGSKKSESGREEPIADPDGWKRGSFVEGASGRTAGAGQGVQIPSGEDAGENVIGGRSEEIRDIVENVTGSAMPENRVWQGRDSVSEKVLRIARAFVQGRGQVPVQEINPGAPVPEQPDPVSGQSSSVSGRSAPVSSQPSSVSGQSAPASGQSSSASGQPASVSRQAVSTSHQTTPVPFGTRMAKKTAPSIPEPGDPARLAELDRQEQEEMERGNVWRQMQHRYPKVLAFDYANGCEILTIKPQDIGMLPRENWVYGNNSFLLHGYYNYRHLILARLENPGGEPRYLLGVPGHYYSNEKNLASMFGFPNFVLARKQPEQDGRFGYWYTDLRL